MKIVLQGNITDLSEVYGKRGQMLTFAIQTDFKPFYDDLKDKQLDIEIKEHKEKRSLDANAYAWVLMGKLSSKLGIKTQDIYRYYVRNIGDNFTTICVKNKAVNRLCEGWERNGIGWITETMPSKIEGCTNVFLYYGSSTYDTKQMSILINHIVEDCREQGIQTETPEQLSNLLSLWNVKNVRPVV